MVAKVSLSIEHTCANMIELLDNDSKEKLKAKLFTAMFEGIDGYYLVQFRKYSSMKFLFISINYYIKLRLFHYDSKADIYKLK